MGLTVHTHGIYTPGAKAPYNVTGKKFKKKNPLQFSFAFDELCYKSVNKFYPR
jgi:hypothetical protein